MRYLVLILNNGSTYLDGDFDTEQQALDRQSAIEPLTEGVNSIVFPAISVGSYVPPQE
jgi:hypothetical protein